MCPYAPPTRTYSTLIKCLRSQLSLLYLSPTLSLQFFFFLALSLCTLHLSFIYFTLYVIFYTLLDSFSCSHFGQSLTSNLLSTFLLLLSSFPCTSSLCSPLLVLPSIFWIFLIASSNCFALHASSFGLQSLRASCKIQVHIQNVLSRNVQVPKRPITKRPTHQRSHGSKRPTLKTSHH